MVAGVEGLRVLKAVITSMSAAELEEDIRDKFIVTRTQAFTKELGNYDVKPGAMDRYTLDNALDFVALCSVEKAKIIRRTPGGPDWLNENLKAMKDFYNSRGRGSG